MSDGFQGARVLVTGARGFVGAHLCRVLLGAGARLVGLDVAPVGPGYLDTEGLAERVDVVSGSVSDECDVSRAFARGPFDFVFHLAAQPLLQRAQADPVATLETNVRGTYMVLEACRRMSLEAPGLLRGVAVASSEGVYGQQGSEPYAEDLPLLATTPYDASKVCADVLARSYAASFGVPVVVVRCTNLYGPGDTNASRIVPGTILRSLRGERPLVRSDGTPERDYLYVADAAEGYLAAGQRASEEGVRGEAFNLGTGRTLSVLELAREVLVACGRADLEPEVQGAPTGRVDRQSVTTDKAARVLGWQATTPLGVGLARTAAWYRDHLSGAQATE